MWNAITEFCKVFAEKHLIPSVISITDSIATLLFLPTDYWMITKLGKWWIFFLVAGVIFLAIQFMIFCCRKIISCINGSEQKKHYKKSTARSEKKDMEELWTAVDKLRPDDRKLLLEFLDSDNRPVVRSSGERYFGNSLLNSNWVVSTEEYGEEPARIVLSEKLKGQSLPVGIMGVGKTLVTKYKLKDDIFNVLKYSKEQYGRISHFE